MSQIYNNKLIGGIGRVQLNTKASNSFPLVGETVTLQALTKWAQRIEFIKKQSLEGSPINETINNTSQATETTITVTTEGELQQKVRAMNFDNDGITGLFSAEKSRYLYAMQPQQLPYFDVEVSEIVRVGDIGSITVKPDNGYSFTREHTITAKIYREDEKGNPVRTLTFDTGGTVEGDTDSFSFSEASDRGIYDIEVSVTDVLLGRTLVKRINKIITITPRLAVRPSEGQQPFGIINGDHGTKIQMYRTGVNDLYATFEVPNLTFYTNINIANFPAGYDAYTLVLSKPASEDGNVYSKIRLAGNGNGGVANASGTPQFSYEHPLVITIDSPTPVEFHGSAYHCVNYDGDIHHTVWDGRGYYNLHNGIKFTKNPVTGELPTTCFQLLNGTSDAELFELEMTDVKFSAIMSKTDPNATNPIYWYGNFEQHNFWFHHNYTHDTTCEGCYLGYYTSEQVETTYTGETVSFKNLKGEAVTYVKGQKYPKKAHYLTNFRFYRNLYERTGYDGVQISNSEGDVCYNTLIGCSYKEEASQTSGLSIQSLTGKCYNNFIYDSHGPNLQIGPIGNLDVFNNVVYSTRGSGIQFLFNFATPEINPTGATSNVINNDIQILFHNNVLVTPGRTVNGRNTVQVMGVHLYDNVLANNGTLFTNMSTATLAKWNEQAVNNVIFNFDELYEKCAEYKISDYENADFRIAHDSPLARMGTGRSFDFDYQGYKNWFNSVYPVGPFMGKYIDASIADSSVRLKSVLLELDTSIDNGVKVTLTCIGTPTHYRLGESEDLSSLPWLEWTEDITYAFDSFGMKTLYAQIKKDSDVSEVMGGSINIPDTSNKIVISLGWGKALLGNKTSLFDSDNLLTRTAITTQGAVGTLYSISGDISGTMTKVDSEGASLMSDNNKGLTTGDNSGIYPDEILERNICTSANTEKYREYKIDIPAGTYKVRLFCSTISRADADRSTYKLSVGGTETLFEKPAGFVLNSNLSTWLEQTITVGNDGFNILFGVNSSGAYIAVPLNIIEVQEA